MVWSVVWCGVWCGVVCGGEYCQSSAIVVYLWCCVTDRYVSNPLPITG